MRKTIAIGLAALVLGGAALAAPDREEEAIRATLEHYLAGHATGDASHFEVAFHPESKLFWTGPDGALLQRTSTDYIARARAAAAERGGKAPDDTKRSRRILMIDHTNTAAVAKIELVNPDRTLIDYMSLLKVNGEWKIVNKIFTPRP